MNEPFDRLEAELQSLRPVELSPRARQRIANELEAVTPARAASLREFAWWSIGIASVVAACLLIALVMRPASPTKLPDDALAPEQPSIATAFDDELPSVWTYRRALERSPLAAEELLDRHAALSAPSQSPNTHVFVRFPSTLHLHGEL